MVGRNRRRSNRRRPTSQQIRRRAEVFSRYFPPDTALFFGQNYTMRSATMRESIKAMRPRIRDFLDQGLSRENAIVAAWDQLLEDIRNKSEDVESILYFINDESPPASIE
jgi:hypothetical protein